MVTKMPTATIAQRETIEALSSAPRQLMGMGLIPFTAATYDGTWFLASATSKEESSFLAGKLAEYDCGLGGN
jgi:hypothetical protein